MFPGEREYRVGSSGFVCTKPEGDAVYYKPGALVWLQAVPQGADLQPTGERRRYETKYQRMTFVGDVVIRPKERKRFDG